MQTQKQNSIREKNSIIPIKQKPININSQTGEYSLKLNFFDPSKSSPPNDFMIKLHMRMGRYHTDNKDDSFDIE